MTRLGLEPRGDRPPVTLFDHLERLERRRVVAARLLHHALAGLREDHLATDRRGLEHALGETAAGPRRDGGFLPPSFSRANRRVQSSKIAAGTTSSARPIFFARRPSSDLPVRIRSSAAGQAHHPRQPRAAAPGREDAEAHFRQADLGLLRVRHEAVVAGQRQLGAAPEAGAVDRRHGRVRQVRELLEERLHPLDRGARVLGLDARELLDVRAGDEDVGLAAARRAGPGSAPRAPGARAPRRARR